MANDSLAPPPSSGGLTYAVVGLGLVAATVALFFLFDCGEKGQVATVDAGQPIERSTSLASDDFDVPDLALEDAGHDAGQAPDESANNRPRVRRAQCNGTLDASAIQAVVGQNRRQVRSCYERALKSNNMLQGRIAVQLTVAPTGAVSSVGVGGSLRDPTVTACVRSLASQWTFPRPTGGCVLVSVPFVMTPRE